MESRETIIKLINENFQAVKHPGNENLLYEGHYAGDEEDVEFLYEFEGKHWSEIKDNNPGWNTTFYPCVLSKEGLMYVIPYLLNLILDHESGFTIASHLSVMVKDWHETVPLTPAQAMTVYMAVDYRLKKYESEPEYLPLEQNPYYPSVVDFLKNLISRYNLKVES